MELKPPRWVLYGISEDQAKHRGLAGTAEELPRQLLVAPAVHELAKKGSQSWSGPAHISRNASYAFKCAELDIDGRYDRPLQVFSSPLPKYYRRSAATLPARILFACYRTTHTHTTS